jgi:hypothetical protein
VPPDRAPFSLYPLVVPFPVVVLDVIGDDLLQVRFAERDHLAEALVLGRPHEPLRERVQIWTPRRQLQATIERVR